MSRRLRGLFQEEFVGSAIVGVGGNPHQRPDRDGLSHGIGEDEAVEIPSQLVENCQRPFPAGVGHQDEKFIDVQVKAAVATADVPVDNLAEFGEEPVGVGVAEGIVDGVESATLTIISEKGIRSARFC